jgi:carboxyl-terminal processing protease
MKLWWCETRSQLKSSKMISGKPPTRPSDALRKFDRMKFFATRKRFALATMIAAGFIGIGVSMIAGSAIADDFGALPPATLLRPTALSTADDAMPEDWSDNLSQDLSGKNEDDLTLEIFEPAPVAVQAPADSEESLLAIGREMEVQSLWGDAVRHYEKATRDYPESSSLYQRLIISRLRQDVGRRMDDSSYLQSVRKISTSQALDLYSEVLANLQTHYVDEVDWSRVMIFGTAALEVAMTEQAFVQRMMPGTSAEKIEAFHNSIHKRLSTRSTATRFDLRATAAYAADVAERELNLEPTAVVLEFLSGAVSTLDTYTRLLSPDQLDDMFSNIEGNFVGLGVELQPEGDDLNILSVIPGGPAMEAGVLAGERIVSVDGVSGKDAGTNRIADLLRGPEFSSVRVAISNRSGEVRELMIPRRRVDVPSVENDHFVDVESGVAYLRITNFQKSTSNDVEEKLWKLHRQGMKHLIIDVRGNPGGLLSAAVDLADRFLADGRIVTTRGRNVRENFDYAAHRQNTWSVPLAVLIDNDSASASEIFAGAIADNARGPVVGQTSYGKGSVQGIFKMQSAKFGLCMTTAKFFSPSGREISRNGVEPTIPVTSSYMAARPSLEDGHLYTDGEDQVLQAAVQSLVRNTSISQRQ